MGAPIIVGDCYDIWISNGMKDAFCEVMTSVAALEGKDISAIYDDAPGVAGTYNISGMGIVLDEFDAYLGGRAGVRAHLDICIARLPEVAAECLTPLGEEMMRGVLAWTAHVMDGGQVPEDADLYQPPSAKGRHL